MPNSATSAGPRRLPRPSASSLALSIKPATRASSLGATTRLSKACAPTSASVMPTPQATISASASKGSPTNAIAAIGKQHSARPVANGRASWRRPTSADVSGMLMSVPTPAAAINRPKPGSFIPRIVRLATTPSDTHRPRISERAHDQAAIRRVAGSPFSARTPASIRRRCSRGPPVWLCERGCRARHTSAVSTAATPYSPTATVTTMGAERAAISRPPMSAPSTCPDVLALDDRIVAAVSWPGVATSAGSRPACAGR
jgi:hypothetical protein